MGGEKWAKDAKGGCVSSPAFYGHPHPSTLSRFSPVACGIWHGNVRCWNTAHASKNSQSWNECQSLVWTGCCRELIVNVDTTPCAKSPGIRTVFLEKLFRFGDESTLLTAMNVWWRLRWDNAMAVMGRCSHHRGMNAHAPFQRASSRVC